MPKEIFEQPEKNDDYLKKPLPRFLFQKILDKNEFHVNETSRLIEDYCISLGFANEEEFIDYVKNKVILDAGSGGENLAKECAIKKIPVQIISLNPRLIDEEFRKDGINDSKELIPIVESQTTGITIEEAQKIHDSMAIAGFFQFLPLKNETIDIILDSNALLYYADRKDEFTQALIEFHRVLKPGGKIRMGTQCFIPESPDNFYENIFKEMGYNYRRIKKLGFNPKNKIDNGYEIIKLKIPHKE